MYRLAGTVKVKIYLYYLIMVWKQTLHVTEFIFSYFYLVQEQTEKLCWNIKKEELQNYCQMSIFI